MADEGSENFGEVQNFLAEANSPKLSHIIAQRDIEFSNSMIEATNKNLKYRFLYHKHIPNHNELFKYVRQAVNDYNNRPDDVLSGLTPTEVLKGKTIEKNCLHIKLLLAKTARIIENKKQKCCSLSF